MPASICRVRKASWQKRYWSKALKAEKAFWVVEEAAWAPAGGPEKAWLVLGAAVNGERDSVMGEELGGQPSGLVCLAGSGPSPELKVESQLCWLGFLGISFQALP